MPSYILKSVETGGYLDGSRELIWEDAMDTCSSPFIDDQNHIRPNSDGTSKNPKAITWNLKPNGKGSYFIQFNQTEYFLDGRKEENRSWKCKAESCPDAEFIFHGI